MSSAYADHQEKISKIYEVPDCLPLTSKQKLLEYGCGVGALSRMVALKSPESQITAIDINSELIHLARVRAKEQGIENIRFLHGDANAIQNIDGNYDGAYCRFLLEEFTKPSEVIKSMSSFVKDGGWICAQERLNNYCRLFPHSEAISQSWDALYDFYRITYGANPSVAEQLQLHFSEAGLKDLKLQGCSRVLSAQTDREQFIWYIDAALSVLGQMEASLIKANLITESILKCAKEDYQKILNSPISFALEVTVCITGTK